MLRDLWELGALLAVAHASDSDFSSTRWDVLVLCWNHRERPVSTCSNGDHRSGASWPGVIGCARCCSVLSPGGADSKSREAQTSCGFDPHLRHQSFQAVAGFRARTAKRAKPQVTPESCPSARRTGSERHDTARFCESGIAPRRPPPHPLGEVRLTDDGVARVDALGLVPRQLHCDRARHPRSFGASNDSAPEVVNQAAANARERAGSQPRDPEVTDRPPCPVEDPRDKLPPLALHGCRPLPLTSSATLRGKLNCPSALPSEPHCVRYGDGCALAESGSRAAARKMPRRTGAMRECLCMTGFEGRGLLRVLRLELADGDALRGVRVYSSLPDFCSARVRLRSASALCGSSSRARRSCGIASSKRPIWARTAPRLAWAWLLLSFSRIASR